MAASIRFRCPSCHARIKAPMQVIGRTHTCPQCRQPMSIDLVIQRGAMPDCGPVLYADEPSTSDAIEQASKGPARPTAVAR